MKEYSLREADPHGITRQESLKTGIRNKVSAMEKHILEAIHTLLQDEGVGGISPFELHCPPLALDKLHSLGKLQLEKAERHTIRELIKLKDSILHHPAGWEKELLAACTKERYEEAAAMHQLIIDRLNHVSPSEDGCS